jgi:hypothetical protein
MNLRFVVPLILALAIFVNGGWLHPQDRRDIQAVIIKVVRDVNKATTVGRWEKAVLRDELRSGHKIRTDNKSLALIRFMDESKLIVRQKSIVEIQGEVRGKEILNRDIHSTRGTIWFAVKKSKSEQFRFSSPISVASIRGTQGTYLAESDSMNKLIITEGLANFTNLISNRTEKVAASQTGIADGRGGMTVRPSTQEEFRLGRADEIDETETGKKLRQLRIPGEDKDGKPRTLIIEWEEDSH